MLDDIGERCERAVVHVGRGLCDIAQSRHLKFAEISWLQRDMARPRRDGGVGRIAVAPEQVVGIGAQAFDPGVASRVDAAGNEERHADVAELAVGERRPEVADAAVALADEDPQPALRGQRIARRGGAVAAQERVAEFVERRARRDQRLDEGRDRLRRVDEDLFVRLIRVAEDAAVAAGELGVVPQDARDLCRARAHLLRMANRAQAERPEAVRPAAPAVPALEPRVPQRRRIAHQLVGCARRARPRQLACVGPRLRGLVAAGAGHPAVATQARVEEEPFAERNGFGAAGNAV